MSRDQRVPVSITWVGKFKVSIYDEALYAASIQQYSQGEENTPTKARKHEQGTPRLFPKQKTRFRWASPIAQARSIKRNDRYTFRVY